MSRVPASVNEFLRGKRFAVAGVSRDGNLPANAIFRKLKASGFDVVPVNPNAETVEGVPCYPNLAAVPGPVDGLVIAAHPDVAAGLVKQAAARGVKNVWFHRSFGEGSVSGAALDACRTAGITPIVGGCPLMYCAPVDVAHRCFRWWLGFKGRLPA
ncbi:MAG: CoA-binding protein [Acidobacteria bacterium]|nr:CoA-binding protein [Acidobacteriota bacterium]